MASYPGEVPKATGRTPRIQNGTVGCTARPHSESKVCPCPWKGHVQHPRRLNSCLQFADPQARSLHVFAAFKHKVYYFRSGVGILEPGTQIPMATKRLNFSWAGELNSQVASRKLKVCYCIRWSWQQATASFVFRRCSSCAPCATCRLSRTSMRHGLQAPLEGIMYRSHKYVSILG